jgi:hypothetical protein
MLYMSRNQLKEIFDRVLTWPAEDQERVARVVHEIEELRSSDDITDEEWTVIEARAARRDFASDKDIAQVFGRYRGA